MHNHKSKIGLVLAGGASLALSHLGVLRALEERGISPSVVAGVSAGSVIGALICAGIPHRELTGITKRVSWYRIITPAFMKPGLAKLDKLADFVEQNTGVKRIEDLKIPLKIATTDLATGKQAIHAKGSLGRIISASCSIPGLFAPVKLGGVPHVDGGITGNLPINSVSDIEDIDTILAVDPLKHCKLNKNPTTLYRVLVQSFVINIRTSSEFSCATEKNIIRIEPRIGFVDPFDLHVLDILEPLGYEEAVRVLDSHGL
ncbi:patatin-like phospholipase family protein [bacterium]|nr:patatin-like phospholipase family protein [bacterium]